MMNPPQPPQLLKRARVKRVKKDDQKKKSIMKPLLTTFT